MTEQQFRSDYALAEHRRCHLCDRGYDLDELVAAFQNDTVVIQAFTGRIFCAPKCWKKYKRSEGLP